MWNYILGSSIVMIAFLLVFALLYFIASSRGMKTQRNHFKELHQKLAVGNKVKFSNGIYGKIKAINDSETVDIQIKSGEIMEVSRYAISEIIE
ncbi:preprotein translocase subunit YajC [Enterococcus sp. LJL120]